MKFKPDVVPVHCDVVLTAGLRVLVSWEGSSLVELACVLAVPQTTLLFSTLSKNRALVLRGHPFSKGVGLYRSAERCLQEVTTHVPWDLLGRVSL